MTNNADNRRMKMGQSMDTDGATYAYVDCEITKSLDALERAKQFNEDQQWARVIANLEHAQAWLAIAVVKLRRQQRIDNEARAKGEIN